MQSWQHDGGEKSFGSQIEAIVPSGNRLYVAERQSRIHVFRLPELSYLTCIGNGQWSGPVFQAQAMTVKDGLIFARDKNGMVSIYKEEDATPENYQKVNRYRRASGNGSPGNNGFASHSMQPDAEGHLLLTDYEGKKIRVLDPALVNDDLANDASIDLDDLSLSPGFKPKTLALCGDRWYATGDNDAINIYERQSNEWSKNETHHWHACSGCDEKNDVEPHTPGSAATENDPQTCTVCGYIIAPATGHIHHTTTLVPAVEATCVDMGHRAYYTCSGCSKLFANENATEELTEADVTPKTDPTNHVGGTEIRDAKDATYTEEGYHGSMRNYCMVLDVDEGLVLQCIVSEVLFAPENESMFDDDEMAYEVLSNIIYQ